MADGSPTAQMGVTRASTSLERETNGKGVDVIGSNRHKLIPKKQQHKISVIENWPKVHTGMELIELIAARGSLMETLKHIKPENNFYKFIRLFNEADDACNDAWTVITTLRGLVTTVPGMPSHGTNEPGILYLLDICAILDMEKAVEKLTCMLLAPNNVEILGSISTRISLLKSTVERVECYTKEVRSWKCIGHILIKGITEGNEQFIRGVLEALEARSVGGKSYEDAIDPKSYLIATEPSTRRTSRHKGIDITMEGSDQEATPQIAPATGKRTRHLSPPKISTIHLTIPGSNNSKIQLDISPDSSSNELESGKNPGSQPSKRLKYNKDATSSDHPILSPNSKNCTSHLASRRSKRFHPITSHTISITPYGPRDQETETHEDSESTTDEDDPVEIRELFEIAKSIYNAQIPTRPKPEVKLNQETSFTEGLRREIEAVQLKEDTTYGNEVEVEPNEEHDVTDSVADEMNDHCAHLQSVRIYDDNSDEGIGGEDDAACEERNKPEDEAHPTSIMETPT